MYERNDYKRDVVFGTGTAIGKRNHYRGSVQYTLGASEFHVNVGKAGDIKGRADTGALQYTVGYNYNLSKRTKVYSFFTRVDNDVNAAYSTGARGADFRSFALGIRHNF